MIDIREIDRRLMAEARQDAAERRVFRRWITRPGFARAVRRVEKFGRESGTSADRMAAGFEGWRMMMLAGGATLAEAVEAHDPAAGGRDDG